MLEKLTTHDIQNVMKLFSLVNKCAKVVPSMPHLLRKWGRVPSPKRALLPRVVAARTKRRRRRPTAGTSR
jgi:hypothetical protein